MLFHSGLLELLSSLGLVSKIVLLMLLIFSIGSWTVILYKWRFCRRQEAADLRFLKPYRRFFFSGRRRHTMSDRDWSSDVCSSDLREGVFAMAHTGTQLIDEQGPRVGHGEDALTVIDGARERSSDVAEQVAFHQAVRNRRRSEERRVGKECRSRWSPYH